MSSSPPKGKYFWYSENAIPQGLAPLVHLVPNHPACLAALRMAYEQLSPPIFNHSLRVFRYALWLAKNDSDVRLPEEQSWGLKFPSEDLFFLASILHDVGTAEEHNGQLRFEVEGGNAAVDLMRSYGYLDTDAREVWIAISCHTSPHVAERIGPLSRLVRLAVVADFSLIKHAKDHVMAAEFEELLPRLDIEDVLAREIVGQVLKCRPKAPHVSWPNALLQGYEANPKYEGVNPEF
jgi:HD superfamily phosphohydrolase YqeK